MVSSHDGGCTGRKLRRGLRITNDGAADGLSSEDCAARRNDDWAVGQPQRGSLARGWHWGIFSLTRRAENTGAVTVT